MSDIKASPVQAVIEDEVEEDAQQDRYLIFQVKDEAYGISISSVTEIIGLQKITPIPESPTFMKGVINLRGLVIPVIDIRSRFNMPQIEYNDRTCIIIVNIQQMEYGFIVDLVNEVIHLAPDQIAPPSELYQGENYSFIRGIGKSGKEMTILLDIEKLVELEGGARPLHATISPASP